MACEYCTDGVMAWKNDHNEGWISDLGTLLIFDEESSHIDEVNINYCFHCGERLGDDNE